MTIKNLLPLCTILTLLGCAKQTTPTGGPKDTIPPTLLQNLSFPKNNQVNVTSRDVQLAFNESVILNNPKEQILIIPDVGKKFDVTAKKKNIVLTFDEPLLPNTTYSLNFRDAVQDITEKNPAQNLKIAFSTGTYIDSLEISGYAVSAPDNKPLKDATIALYQSDTFDIFTHTPIYITKTNDKGAYDIQNLKPGQYFLYGISDKNKNLIADSRTEGYAFNTAPIELKRNKQADTLNFIRLDMRPIKLTSARPFNTYFNIRFSKGIKEYKLTTQDSSNIPSILTSDHSTIKLYDVIATDSAIVQLQALDSAENKIDTTFYYKFLAKVPTPEKFTIKHATWRALSSTGNIEGSLTYDKPISKINFDSILYQIDSATTIRFDSSDITDNSIARKITIKKIISPKQLTTTAAKNPPVNPRSTQKTTSNTNKLYFGKGAFISIEGDSSQQYQQELRPVTAEETSILHVHISTNRNSFIVQVINKNNEIIDFQRNTKKCTFQNLPPGDYQIRLIIDHNNDGVWTAGNFQKKTNTEPARYYQNERNNPTITLKANWEVGPLLITY